MAIKEFSLFSVGSASVSAVTEMQTAMGAAGRAEDLQLLRLPIPVTAGWQIVVTR